MSTKRKQPSTLVEAAQAFDEALEAHARAGELFVRGSLSTTKQLERANELLGEIAAAEQLLAERGAALAAAINAAHVGQQQTAQAIVDRIPAIKERNERLQALLGAFQAIGAETSALNGTAATAKPADLIAPLNGLAERASTLAADAHTAGFEELAREAHALHQRLASTARKLAAASPS
ncbi:MAG TPA: hypothetical protein VM261_08170 [Kofleriaceae bacterium]|nr:hypothetical protein [Kofleriaceae bacterium]